VSEKEVAAFFDTVLDETGRIDVLVNNAGITRDGLLVRMKEKDWDAVIDVNLKGTFNCTRIAAKTMMKQRSGHIINIASVVGVTGNPGQVNYVASKAGIIGFTKAVAKELATRGITVNAVAPGFIETDMTAILSDTVKAAMIDQIPLGRSGKPEDVADVVAFLASAKAAYITGQIIHVSGGMYI
jgi:3-oxoacyl-[acyl-carrier protein] reductase